MLELNADACRSKESMGGLTSRGQVVAADC